MSPVAAWIAEFQSLPRLRNGLGPRLHSAALLAMIEGVRPEQFRERFGTTYERRKSGYVPWNSGTAKEAKL